MASGTCIFVTLASVLNSRVVYHKWSREVLAAISLSMCFKAAVLDLYDDSSAEWGGLSALCIYAVHCAECTVYSLPEDILIA